MKKDYKKIIKYTVLVLFLMYCLVLIKVILFKYPLSMMEMMINNPSNTIERNLQGGNFIPFNTIIYYISGEQSFRIAIENILGNMIAFAPLGLFIPIIYKNKKLFKKTVLIAFLTSLLFEIIQLFLGIGSFDVDDILLNISGALMGYMLYVIVVKLGWSEKFYNN